MNREQDFAPIVIFAYNRPSHLKQSIDSLLLNSEAVESDLFVFVDGAKNDKDITAITLVNEVLSSVKGFKSIKIYNSTKNKGLAQSIIDGVSLVIKQYGRAIVLEDDLIYSQNFLSFMNHGLQMYKVDDRIFSICGYSHKINVPKKYSYDTYFCTRSNSCGWATWSDRWHSIDWLLNDWRDVKSNRRKFNSWGGSDCFALLKAWKCGRNNSWAIRFCYSQFLQGKLSLFPILSKVQNNGFDGSGTNSQKYSRFKCDFDNVNSKSFTYPKSKTIDRVILRSSLRYHSITLRLWSRLMYILNK